MASFGNASIRRQAPSSGGTWPCEHASRQNSCRTANRIHMRREDPRTDARIVADTLAGDTESFAVIVDRHQRRVFRLVLRMVGNRDDADDLSQEVFCKLFQTLDRYDASLPLENWLVRIATNHTLNWLAKRRIRTIPIGDGEGDSRRDEPRDLTPSPSDLAAGNEVRDMVLVALQTLPENLRLAFVLKYMEDYTSEEIAEIADVPRNTAKTWVFRARDALRRELAAMFARHSNDTKREPL
jgi:RNA polymerase sigma-70 factor, ECF subfamily